MFYAKELSMEVKSDISLIYYISTTNNNRKINKKEINKINIERTLSSILDQSYALRLYSYILKGVLKIYIIKMKYYETEVSGLLNMLQYKIRRRIIKKEISCTNENDIYDEDIYGEDIYDGNKENSNIKNVNNDNINFKNFNDINYLYEGGLCTEFLENDIMINNYIDIELKENSKRRKKITKKLRNITNFHFIKEYPIFKLINLNLENPRTTESIELVRNTRSSNILTSFSDNRDNISSFSENKDKDSFSFDPFYSDCNVSHQSILEYFDIEDNFNKLCVGSRHNQARNFYELLELLNNGNVTAYQDNYYSDIIIKRL